MTYRSSRHQEQASFIRSALRNLRWKKETTPPKPLKEAA